MRLVAILSGVILVSACGQTGALYLPDEAIETPVEIRTPATTPASTPPVPEPESGSVPEPDDDKDEKDKQDAPPPSG